MNNLSLKWGLIGGFIGIIGGLLLYFAGFTDVKALQYVIMLLMFLPIFFGQKEYMSLGNSSSVDHDNLLDKKSAYSFGELFKVGFFILLVMAIISVVWNYVYVNYIDVGLMDRALALAEKQLEERGLSEEEIVQAVEMSKTFMTPSFLALMTLLSSLFFGSIFNVFSSLINKTK